MRSLLARAAALVMSVALAACGGSSTGEGAAGDTLLASIIAPGLASTAVASDSQGAIWLVWTERQAGLPGSVNAVRIRPDGQQDRWTLARDDGWFGVLTLNFIDDRPLVGWYQAPLAGRAGVRVMSFSGAGWLDEVAASGANVTSDYQFRAAPDGAAWLLVRDLLPMDGGSRCTVQRRLSPGTWSSPLDVDTTGSMSAARCVMAPGRGGELMVAWSNQAIASSAPPTAVRSAYLAAGAQQFEAPTTAVSVPSYVDRLESVGAGRWVLLWYAVSATNDVSHNIQLFRRGQWSGSAQPIGVPGESNYALRATANGSFVDVAWTGIRIGDLPGGSAPRAARFDADNDTLEATQSLGRFNPSLLYAWSAGVAPDGRVAAGFSTVTGPGEAWLALGDANGIWRPAFRIGHPSRGAIAPTALPMPDGSWAAVWQEFSAQAGTLDLLMRRVR